MHQIVYKRRDELILLSMWEVMVSRACDQIVFQGYIFEMFDNNNYMVVPQLTGKYYYSILISILSVY